MAAVLEHMLISCSALVNGTINPPLSIVDHNDASERWDELRLEFWTGYVRDEVCQERDVRAGFFAWEIRFDTDDEVAGLEVVESR